MSDNLFVSRFRRFESIVVKQSQLFIRNKMIDDKGEESSIIIGDLTTLVRISPGMDNFSDERVPKNLTKVDVMIECN